MKKLILAALVALVIAPAVNAQDDAQAKRYNMYGVMFYNLENLFDTINSNGTYDLEFSPSGARQWDGRKYWSKINRMAYAISQMKTSNTPMGPAIIGVSEIENVTVATRKFVTGACRLLPITTAPTAVAWTWECSITHATSVCLTLLTNA